jgi:chromosome partitioning protein
MADEPSDQRPKRRLFGRRRSEHTADARPGTPAAVAEDLTPAPDVDTHSDAVHPDSESVADVDPNGARHEAAAPESTGDAPVEAGEASVEPAPVEAGEASVEAGEASVEPAPVEPTPTAEASTAPADASGTASETNSTVLDRDEDEDVSEDGETTEAEEADAAEHREVAPVAASTGDAVLPLPRVIAIANQKGGVGKTTTAVNLGAALAEAGFRTLVVDLDPQGNASTGLGISPRDVETSVYDVIMTDAPALDCVEPTSLKNLFVLPATIDLAGAEIELVAAFSRELKLRRALDVVRLEYDVILIDCPPSLGLLTVNGLAAADDVIVPVQSEYYALEGLGQLLKNVSMVRSVNPTLDVRGIVLTMHDSRTKLAEQVESEVRQHFGTKVYKTVVPRTVRLSEAPSFGQPIIVFDPTSRGASAYRELAKEVSGGATRRSG